MKASPKTLHHPQQAPSQHVGTEYYKLYKAESTQGRHSLTWCTQVRFCDNLSFVSILLES